MKLLADENIHAGIVRWLREQGHDVKWVVEAQAGANDLTVLDSANATGCVLLTSDLDFGELVFQRQMVSAGVILLRLEGLPITQRLALLAERWPVIERQSSGHFVVVTEHRTRIRPMRAP